MPKKKLFAPGLFTRGEDDEGIRGFLKADIVKECKRVKPLRCAYCSEPNANIGCSVAKCKMVFHFDCGLDNRANFQFCGNYPSYCMNHKPKTAILKKVPKKDEICGICTDSVDSKNALLVPCCKNGWFHRKCLQKAATSAGVFFKCPLCNEEEKFKKDLQLQGIFIPEKDADWELEAGAFQDLVDTPVRICEFCMNEKQDQINYQQLRWKLCNYCGSSAVHLECLESSEQNEFNCASCLDIVNKPKSPPSEPLKSVPSAEESDDDSPFKPVKRSSQASSSEDEEDATIKMKKKKFKQTWFSEDEEFTPVMKTRNKKPFQRSRTENEEVANTKTANGEDREEKQKTISTRKRTAAQSPGKGMLSNSCL